MASTDKSFDYFDVTQLSNSEMLSIFLRHRQELSDRVSNMSNEISHWAQSLMSQIEETKKEAERLLYQEYECQRNYIEEKRREYIQKALIYQKNNDKEQMEQLITQCNALKFELAALEYSTHRIRYLTLVSHDNLNRERLQSTSIDGHKNEMHTTESYPPRNTEQKSRWPLIRISSDSDNKNQSVTYPDPDAPINDDCPICNMVFSLHMKSIDRTIHVEEHFTDNIGNISLSV